VTGGDEILPGVRALMASGRFARCVATQDWHPPDHVSFASRHPGQKPMDAIRLYGREQVLWPDHCVQGTPGAELHPDLPWARASAIVRKGTDRDRDSYSAFRNNWGPDGQRAPTGLAGYLREIGATDVHVCGLARDVCCKWTAEDAAEAGFRVHFWWDLTRSVDPSADDRLRDALAARGVRLARGPGR
jgi:nicotinamidase/pyrazinamidase